MPPGEPRAAYAGCLDARARRGLAVALAALGGSAAAGAPGPGIAAAESASTATTTWGALDPSEQYHKESVEDFDEWAHEELAAALSRPPSPRWETAPISNTGWRALREVLGAQSHEKPVQIYVVGRPPDGEDIPADHHCSFDVGALYGVEQSFLQFVLGSASILAESPEEADYVYFPHCAMSAYFFLHTAYMREVKAGRVSSGTLRSETNKASFIKPVVAAVDEGMLAGTLAERVERSPAAAACERRQPRGRCRLLFVNFLGRTWLPEFSRRFPDAVMVTHAAESAWISEGGGQGLYYWGRRNDSSPVSARAASALAGTRSPERDVLREEWPRIGELEPTAQQDIPLPLPVYSLWTPRSAEWEGRDVLACFAGALNSPARQILFHLFGDANAPEDLDWPAYRWRDQWHRAAFPRPDVQIHGSARRLRIREASDLMYRSRLCLTPDGDQPNTERLVEAVAHGCVPLIISSHWLPPFRRLITWRRCAIFVREEDVQWLPELLDELERRPELLREMHGRLEMLSHALVHGGLQQQSWGYPGFLLAELIHRQEEGVALRRMAAARGEQGVGGAPAPPARESGPRVGEKVRKFEWFAGGKARSNDPEFWNLFLLPPTQYD